MFGLGSQEILIILVIALVVFGAGKLPQIGDGMGKAIKNFKKAAKDAEDVVDITPKSNDQGKITEGDSEDKKS
ncbi:MAG: twin-arginine translocase TatA/TatE family subunit [Deferribacterales bacterium]